MRRKNTWQRRRKMKQRLDGRKLSATHYECADCEFQCFTRPKWMEHQYSTGHKGKKDYD